MYLFLSLVCDINLSLSNSYKDHRNGYTVHSVTQHVCFSSDRELPQCSVCMKMSVELGLTLYLLRFLPLLALSCATIFLTISSLPALSSSVSRRRTMISPSPLLAVYGYRRLSLLRELRSTSHSFKFGGERQREGVKFGSAVSLLFRTLFFQFSRLGRASSECGHRMSSTT